jgi:Fe-S-cluster containining protein
MSEEPKRVLVLEEEEVRVIGLRQDGEEDLNPYWAEPEPHPNPELGCIRRGLCCKSSPGWFAPGEVEGAIELLGMEPREFIRTYLIIDGMEIDGERVDVFAPVKLGRDGLPLEPPASRATKLYSYLRGPCIFYGGDQVGCRIHGAHPLECRRYVCTNAPEDNITHREIAQLWKDGQTQA